MSRKTKAASADGQSAPQRQSSRTATSKASNGSAATSQSPSYDDIAHAAYLRYIGRGGTNGSDFDDWVEAERELSQRQQ